MSPANALPDGVPYSTLERSAPPALALLAWVAIGHAITPEEFGAATIALAIVRILSEPIERLFRDALVQRKELDASHVSAAFMLSLVLAGSLCAGCQWLAFMFETAWQQPLLAEMLKWMSPSLLGTGLGSVLAALQRRRGELRTLALCGLGGAVGSTAIAIAVLVQGGGVYSLVVHQLSFAWLGTLIIWLMPHERPHAWLDLRSVLALIRFRAPRRTKAHWWALARYTSVLVVGAWFGNAGAGVFGFALRCFEALHEFLTRALSPFAHSIHANAAGDVDTHATRLTTFTRLGIFVGLAMFSDVIATALGPAWSGASVPIRVLALLYAVFPVLEHAILRGIRARERRTNLPQ